jgi:hypothetical protein
MKNVELDKTDTINDTKTKSIDETWIIIGGEKKWIRKCPKCNDEIYHTSYKGIYHSKRNNRKCRKCGLKERSSKIIQKNNFSNINFRQRTCPTCNKILTYPTKHAKEHCEKQNTSCKECGYKNREIILRKIRPKKEIKEEDLVRTCPKCQVKIKYISISNKNKAERNKTNCNNCSKFVISNTLTGRTLLNEIREKISKTLKGRKNTWGEKISKSRKRYYESNPNKIPKGNKNPMYGIHRNGEQNPNYGNKWNKEQRKAARIRTIENLKNKGIKFGYKGANNFNPKACDYFNELNKERGWNLQHALNGGEVECIGYSLDAYDKQKNIVVEYDEKHHKSLRRQEKDKYRQKEIINELQCKFYRYDEPTLKLKEY